MKYENIDKFSSLFYQLLQSKIAEGNAKYSEDDIRKYKCLSYVDEGDGNFRYTILSPLRDKLSSKTLGEIEAIADGL